jgi:hypothetical protein
MREEPADIVACREISRIGVVQAILGPDEVKRRTEMPFPAKNGIHPQRLQIEIRIRKRECGAFTESSGLTVYAAALFLNQQNVVLWERSVVTERDL